MSPQRIYSERQAQVFVDHAPGMVEVPVDMTEIDRMHADVQEAVAEGRLKLCWLDSHADGSAMMAVFVDSEAFAANVRESALLFADWVIAHQAAMSSTPETDDR